jgi:maleylpyruvate isomerase
MGERELIGVDQELRRDLAGMRAAHAAVEARLSGLDDAGARRPSRLPGWSVGHLVTHLARNADSVTRRLDGVARGRVVDQYVGGAAGRAAEIEEGSGRPAAELVDDLVAAHAHLDAAVGALGEEAWEAPTRSVDGTLRPARDLPRGRWREVEVHHVDLGLGYEPVDWPDPFVTRILPYALADVGRRLPGLAGVDPRAIVAWSYGRGEPPAGLPVLDPF